MKIKARIQDFVSKMFAPRHRPLVARIALAGPGTILGSLLVIMGMPLWLPVGAAGIDQLVFPLLLMPLIWGVLFFHACLDRSLMRAAIVALMLCATNGAMVTWHMIASERPKTLGVSQ